MTTIALGIPVLPDLLIVGPALLYVGAQFGKHFLRR